MQIFTKNPLLTKDYDCKLRLDMQNCQSGTYLLSLQGKQMSLCQIKSVPQQNLNVNSFFLFTGDIRANEHHGLTVMHTLWMREHNKIAKLLSQQYPSWTDEKLYQEARRIVIAEYQHIAFREWLPQVLGTQFCIDCELTPLQGISYHTESS